MPVHAAPTDDPFQILHLDQIRKLVSVPVVQFPVSHLRLTPHDQTVRPRLVQRHNEPVVLELATAEVETTDRRSEECEEGFDRKRRPRALIQSLRRLLDAQDSEVFESTGDLQDLRESACFDVG